MGCVSTKDKQKKGKQKKEQIQNPNLSSVLKNLEENNANSQIEKNQKSPPFHHQLMKHMQRPSFQNFSLNSQQISQKKSHCHSEKHISENQQQIVLQQTQSENLCTQNYNQAHPGRLKQLIIDINVENSSIIKKSIFSACHANLDQKNHQTRIDQQLEYNIQFSKQLQQKSGQNNNNSPVKQSEQQHQFAKISQNDNDSLYNTPKRKSANYNNLEKHDFKIDDLDEHFLNNFHMIHERKPTNSNVKDIINNKNNKSIDYNNSKIKVEKSQQCIQEQ